MGNEQQIISLSIVIVNYNAAEFLQACLDSIVKGSCEDIEIFVVDNGSTDGNEDLIKSRYQHLFWIANTSNIGFSAANNLALSRVRGRFILLLNPDTVLPPNALRELLDFMEQHPAVGMCGPKLVRADGKLDRACCRSFPTKIDIISHLSGLDYIFPQSRVLSHYNQPYRDPDSPGEVDCISGAFMLLRKDAMESVGLLDERFFMYGEDVDWALRFKERGWIIYYYPRISVLHHKRATAIKVAPAMIREFYRSTYIYYEKHFASNTPIAINIFFRIFLAMRMVLALIFWWAFNKWV